jgi:hypothetical protein
MADILQKGYQCDQPRPQEPKVRHNKHQAQVPVPLSCWVAWQTCQSHKQVGSSCGRAVAAGRQTLCWLCLGLECPHHASPWRALSTSMPASSMLSIACSQSASPSQSANFKHDNFNLASSSMILQRAFGMARAPQLIQMLRSPYHNAIFFQMLW